MDQGAVVATYASTDAFTDVTDAIAKVLRGVAAETVADVNKGPLQLSWLQHFKLYATP